ncbi:MAG: hypothetical protein ACRDN0_37825 [Trebonia sp.]
MATSAQRARVRAAFTDHGITPGQSAEAKENCVQLLADGQIRDRFETELNRFLGTVDTVLPLPAAREFLPDAGLFAEIATRSRRRYRETGDFDPSLYGEKVRELIDEHMTSLGVDQILPPVSITDPEYQARAAKLGPRARASEMEHAIRHHINLHMEEDPTRYRRLSWTKSKAIFPKRPMVTLPEPIAWNPRCTAFSRRRPLPTASSRRSRPKVSAASLASSMAWLSRGRRSGISGGIRPTRPTSQRRSRSG